MKKRNLILVAVLAVAATATGASAENANSGFDPILDADHLDYWMDGTVEGGRNYVPEADADFIDLALVGLPETGRNIEVEFDPILDADLDMGYGEIVACRSSADLATR